MTQTLSFAPRIWILPEALQKIKLYIELAKGEISGLGTAVLDEGEPLIQDVMIFPQECTASDSELDMNELSKWTEEAVKAGLDPGQLKLWWHSHANMGTFWSADDVRAINSFRNGWMLSLVGNKAGQMRVRLDLWEPVRVVLDELSLLELTVQTPGLREALQKEVEEKVKAKSFPAAQNYYQGWRPQERGLPLSAPTGSGDDAEKMCYVCKKPIQRGEGYIVSGKMLYHVACREKAQSDRDWRTYWDWQNRGGG